MTAQLFNTLIISHDKINIVQFLAHFLLQKNTWQFQETTVLFQEEKEEFKQTKKPLAGPKIRNGD